eukprot:869819_1
MSKYNVILLAVQEYHETTAHKDHKVKDMDSQFAADLAAMSSNELECQSLYGPDWLLCVEPMAVIGLTPHYHFNVLDVSSPRAIGVSIDKMIRNVKRHKAAVMEPVKSSSGVGVWSEHKEYDHPTFTASTS